MHNWYMFSFPIYPDTEAYFYLLRRTKDSKNMSDIKISRKFAKLNAATDV